MAIIIAAPLSLMFIIAGLPLFFKKVKRNYFYGYRVSHYAMLDDDIWYAVNRRGGQHLMIMGGLLGVTAILAVMFKNEYRAQESILYVDLIITVSGAVYSLINGQALNNRLAKAKGLRDHISPKQAYKLEN